MATRRQPLTIGWLLPGLTAATVLVVVALAAFLALWSSAPEAAWMTIVGDSYLWHVVRFSFWQAFLSALLSVVPAIFLARALYRRRFPGRTLLLRLCAMTLILPVLVAVFGILSVYGRQGWLAAAFNALDGSGISRPTGCRGSCWRTSSSICRWRPACCCRRWRISPANSGKLRPSLACAAFTFSASSSGRGCGGKFLRWRR
ncbi:thiamine transporter membrane protein [Raoultella terrigena]|uniref:Thiamine transporter membrane protein n=1 Tax=Raoultella terrigena TaxID=577 RepID=A0A4U9D8W2_RAOTE|nr:thiamine transporter membrane protein [Raoultella terrigena]